MIINTLDFLKIKQNLILALHRKSNAKNLEPKVTMFSIAFAIDFIG